MNRWSDTEFQQSGGWTDKRVRVLTFGVNSGLSAAMIAKNIGGGCTRSSVCKKVSRLGLQLQGKSCRPNPNAPKKPKTRRRDRLVETRPASQPLPKHVEPEAVRLANGQHITTADLEPQHCRWPHGDPREPNFHYCGRDKVEGTPFCPIHKARAWIPNKPRERSDREFKGVSKFAYAGRAA